MRDLRSAVRTGALCGYEMAWATTGRRGFLTSKGGRQYRTSLLR